ncbi:hypothetical protein ACWCP6_34500 [Streptomyces sp. NPDC002004]
MAARRVVCALLLTVAALTGCQAPSGTAGGAPSSAPSPSPSGYGAVFLGVGDCGARGQGTFTEVPCTSESAVAKVVARHARGGTPLCPEHTDFVLHIATVPEGYACMRNLEPPHPGDPGAGGGPRTVVGDCVFDAARGRVRETPCDGSGERRPQYRITTAVPHRAQCPSSTALYVRLGGPRPVGCAVRLAGR